MAREPSKSHKHKHRREERAIDQAPDVQAHQKSSKSSKFSKSHRHRTNATAKDPPKQIEKGKKLSKPKKFVSAAGVFKVKKSKHDDKKHRKRKARTPTPEPDLKSELRDGIEGARAVIDKTLHASFNAAHNDLLTRLSASRERDIAFFESISATANMLSAPLGDEQIETTFTREGKRVTEVVEIGKRIELFKKSVEKDEAKLKGYWKQWDDLQGDFVELGMEVFGPEVFGTDANEAREKGFKKDMELLDVENDARVEELGAEVEEIADEYLEKMKESEKELDASARRQQAKLLQALISE